MGQDVLDKPGRTFKKNHNDCPVSCPIVPLSRKVALSRPVGQASSKLVYGLGFAVQHDQYT